MINDRIMDHVSFGQECSLCVVSQAQKLKGLGHAILGNFITDQMVIELLD